jgi:TetR/AcrR family transcriptional regulator, fatty acid metabolism regulator protein
MPTNQDRKETRHQKILDAALNVFSRQGYHEAAVDEIASLAETSKGGVYFHFPGKQSIFLALLDRSANLLLSRITERMEETADPVEKVDAALYALVQVFSSHRALARLLLLEARGAGPEFHAKLMEIHSRFAAFITENLDEAVSLGIIHPLDTRTAGIAWFGALNQVITTWILSEEPGDLEDTYPALRTLLLRGVGAHVETSS